MLLSRLNKNGMEMPSHQIIVAREHDQRLVDEAVDVAQVLDGDVTLAFGLDSNKVEEFHLTNYILLKQSL